MKAMMKMVRQEAEKAKTSVRSIRHKALEAVKKEYRSADDRKRAEKEVSVGGWVLQGSSIIKIWLGVGV